MILNGAAMSRSKILLGLALCAVVLVWMKDSHIDLSSPALVDPIGHHTKPPPPVDDGKFHWANVRQQYPVESFKTLPSPAKNSLPRIQHKFGAESTAERRLRESRLKDVKGNFTHAWIGYRKQAWLHDEVKPVSGEFADPFGGWAATLVDNLDTLWIMEFHDEFHEAVEATRKIDFTTCAIDELNVFETTIRYFGGFLSAYDLCRGKYKNDIELLRRATEIGDMLYKAFDTPNRMPIVRWNFKNAIEGLPQEAGDGVMLAEIGTLTLEFTRLSQITGDPKYYDAVQRITDTFEREQSKTKLPGMWPIFINARSGDYTDFGGFSTGAMADSMFEYLPKVHMLLGGGTQQYRRLYEYAMTVIRRNIFFRPMTRDNLDIRLAGAANSDGKTQLQELKVDPQVQHLGCFAGGMVLIAGKLFGNDQDLILGRKLVEGCLWAYEIMPNGIMPETLHAVACEDEHKCRWDEKKWHKEVNQRQDGEESVELKIRNNRLPPGIAHVDDAKYHLRPEAIESVWILYRMTGDKQYLDRAWSMFNSIVKHSITEVAHAGIDNVMKSQTEKMDRMESFWQAETLKYFYLMFSKPNVISLDEWVLNTEAHPLKRNPDALEH